jgi:peroxiredoxin
LFSVTIFADVQPIDNGKFMALTKESNFRTLIVFWATYCPHCKRYLKTINENEKYFTEHHIKVIAISTDYSKSLVDDFAKTNHYFFPLYYDNDKLKIKYHAYYIPLTVIFDKDGHLDDSFPGNKSMTELKTRLED